ncbi:hypothetical protein PanWU01x14_238830 [Parasponia andersonii]|uniref:Uncharacterized protein n=1 Tax=Parasponia andersonii TaxID=3476 RepID=A0A2P5BHJ8_PARAD|nr:hypothetical protein PanWU01x14_238830 [Parasponia andersonii]
MFAYFPRKDVGINQQAERSPVIKQASLCISSLCSACPEKIEYVCGIWAINKSSPMFNVMHSPNCIDKFFSVWLNYDIL